MTPLPYNPSRWFWAVGGSTTQVYSGQLGNYVAVSNQQYQAWLASGNTPSSIDTETSLGGVLAAWSLGNKDSLTRPVPAAILDAYQNAWADELSRVFQTLLSTANLNMENRIRACERALGISTAPDLTNAQLKSLIKSMM